MTPGSRPLTEHWEHLDVRIEGGICEVTLDRP
jgi:hypothetical protein